MIVGAAQYDSIEKNKYLYFVLDNKRMHCKF